MKDDFYNMKEVPLTDIEEYTPKHDTQPMKIHVTIEEVSIEQLRKEIHHMVEINNPAKPKKEEGGVGAGVLGVLFLIFIAWLCFNTVQYMKENFIKDKIPTNKSAIIKQVLKSTSKNAITLDPKIPASKNEKPKHVYSPNDLFNGSRHR